MKKILIAIGIVFCMQEAEAQFRPAIGAHYYYSLDSNQGVYIRSNLDNVNLDGGPENIRFQVGEDRAQSYPGGGNYTNRYVAEINKTGIDFLSGTKINFLLQPFSEINTSGRLTFIADSDNGGNNGAHAADDFRFKIGTSEKLLIQRTLTTLKTNTEFQGNVGLGTSSPQERIHVYAGNVRVDNGQYQSWGPLVLHADVDNSGDDSIEFRNSSNEEMVIIQDGNIDLLIRGNHGGGEIRSNGPLKFKPEADNNGTNDVIAFYNGENQEMVRMQDGVITTDQVRLNVTSFPDYVFAKDYDLMPLKEVATYIKANKHLPHMPTEAQVIAEGMNIGQINTILVEKVEELTLHTINQEEKIEQLMKKIEALEAAMNK
ncbi:hypothetical protein [Aquimarina rhabdastrellae]